MSSFVTVIPMSACLDISDENKSQAHFKTGAHTKHFWNERSLGLKGQWLSAWRSYFTTLGNRVGAGLGQCLLPAAHWNHRGALRNCRCLAPSQSRHISISVWSLFHYSPSPEFDAQPWLRTPDVVHLWIFLILENSILNKLWGIMQEKKYLRMMN